MSRHVALLRAVNVGGRKLSMAELRALGGEIGLRDVATYIQSGNVVFTSEAPAAETEQLLERAIAERFGMTVPVIVRDAAAWAALRGANPFPDAAEMEPNRLLVCVPKQPPKNGAIETLQERTQTGERVAEGSGSVWIHYAAGVASSKLTPTAIDRAIGSPSTARNWRTVVKLGELLAAETR